MAMSLKATVRNLQREFSETFHVVGQPDHPMLLSGPDILIGGEGRLTCIFWVDKKDTASSLLARITAARLALPPTTRILVAVAENAEVPAQVSQNTDEIFAQREWRSILRYASGNGSFRGDQNALKESKRQHSEKFAFALLLATLRQKHELETAPPDAVIRDLARFGQETPNYSRTSLRLRRPTAQVRGSVVTSLSPKGRPAQQLRSCCDAGFTYGYTLDTGVPYPKSDASLNILLVEDWPMGRYDPDKPLRSAAFSGWIMSKSSDAREITKLIDRSNEPQYFRRWRNA